jgi:hypothetical protein
MLCNRVLCRHRFRRSLALPQARIKDGRSWRIGTAADVAWIERAVDFSTRTITQVPPGFAAYCRLELPDLRYAPPDQAAAAQAAHDQGVVDVLGAAPGSHSWWLGYLEYGIGVDLVFDDAPRTSLFGWDFVLVQAGPQQALGWRAHSTGATAWKGALPDLIFPADRAWMLFTSWDDVWSGIGGSEDLIGSFERDPRLGPRVRLLTL